MTGNEENQDKNKDVFEVAFERIKANLQNNKNVVFDATNINYRNRKDTVGRFRKYADKIECIFVYATYEECLERNNKRDRKVPEEVIKRMYMNFFVPQKFEGFDKITICYNSNSLGGSKEDLLEKLDIPHENPFHKLSILEHTLKAYNYFKKESLVKEAALLHDIGKPFCKTYINSRGQKTDIAHYYGHEKVSAYDSFIYTSKYTASEKFYIAKLIQWHMLLHNSYPTKTTEKYKKMLGKTFYRDLEKLHRADLYAD